MKRFVSPVILIVGLLLAGFAGTVQAQVTGTSAVTVVVPVYIAIDPPPAMIITMVTPGVEATGTIGFNVDANVPVTIEVGTIVQPGGLTGLDGSVDPISTAGPASTSVTLTGRITVLLIEPANTYLGGSILVTVVKTP